MDACSLRQDQQLGRDRWWRSRLRSETGRSEQGRYILRHSAVGGLTGARSVWRKISRQVRSYDMRRIAAASELEIPGGPGRVNGLTQQSARHAMLRMIGGSSAW